MSSIQQCSNTSLVSCFTQSFVLITGECGDNWSLSKPRPHEFGGKWGQGVIVREYNPGSEMTIRIELTASHMGYFEFRLCDNVQADQDCLDKHLLKVLGGSPSTSGPNDLETRFYPRNGSRIYEIKTALPDGFECGHCVLQWRYIAGNNWGTCPDGSGAVGCGPQEEFRACADVAIGEGKGTQQRPSRPSIKPKTTTVKPPKDDEVTAEPAPTDNEIPSGPQYMGPVVALISLFLVLCFFAAIYIYHYHRSHFKLFMRWQHNKKVQNLTSTTTSSFPVSTTLSNVSSSPSDQLPPPVPPPRTRRNTSFLQLNTSSSSILLNSDKNTDSTS